MRTLVHLSDLHFGRVDPAVLAPLAQAVADARPDVVVVSGDLTQRARRAQFREAAGFLARLPQPQVVVPGNHDVPLYDVGRRLLAPLARFRRYVHAEPFPEYADDTLTVIGVNTARALVFKGGRINRGQVGALMRRFRALPAAHVRVVVSHHPFEQGPHATVRDRVGRADMARRALAGCRIDLFLSGHLHRSHQALAEPVDEGGYAGLVVHAGTATSTRGRGEANAFNVLRVTSNSLVLDTLAFDPRHARFASVAQARYRRSPERGWALAGDRPARFPPVE
ncbi:MAG: metallophosphoesterase [Lysobacter sp.]|nr:metallophosphoesterase [Lysobacter sp.]